MKTVRSRLNQIIVENLAVEPERLIDDTYFVDDLGADSLDCVELTMACEEEFNIAIDDDRAIESKTVGQAEKMIQALLAMTHDLTT